MQKFFINHYKDCIAFSLLIICLISLIVFDRKISDSLRQTLGYVIVGCLGFIFRGTT
ncbi:hypothetical protein Murru_1238 [Allomuricauda ruestringensis DSM 13258]|uniref:Uncharacterized protein n=1 Tax=Allomuricauda ruestringensis (strain DSM 13258 / CIP 107369 / LMG 19739 / B1) TaxID=886377 RepID=G2PNU6_ALLRU|nr:hypothetical protein Murru_1238 [Allomuricauda ruestringensis DSM 13258]